VLDPAATYFVADSHPANPNLVEDSDEVRMCVAAAQLPGDVIEAAHRIAADTDHDDVLLRIADSLAAEQTALIGPVADGNAISDAFPPVIVLDGDPESLSAELRKALPVIHDRLWDRAWLDAPFDFTAFGAIGRARVSDPFPLLDPLRSLLGDPSARHLVDPWLERRSDSAEPEIAVDFEAYGGAADWYRVRHSTNGERDSPEEE
jgi:hypothetical protein